MPKYTEDANILNIVDDSGNVINSFDKSRLDDRALNALRQYNQPLAQAAKGLPDVSIAEGAPTVEIPAEPQKGMARPMVPQGQLGSLYKERSIGEIVPQLKEAPSEGKKPASKEEPKQEMPQAQTNLQAAMRPSLQRTGVPLDSAQISAPFNVPVQQPRSQMSYTSQTTEQKPQKFEQDADLYKRIEENARMEKSAIKADEELKIASIEAQKGVLEANRQAQLDLQEKQQKTLQEQQEKIQQAQNDYTRIYDEYQKKEFGIFDNKTVAQQTLAGLSILLGGIGAGMQGGGPNVALGILQKNVEQNMQREKERLLAAQDKIGQTKKSYDEIVASINAQGAASWEQIARKAEEMAIMNGSQLAKNEATKLVAMANQKATQYQMAALDRLRGTVSTTTTEQEKEAPKTSGLEIPGFGIAQTADDAKQMKEIVQQTTGAKQSIDELLKIADTGSAFNPSDRAKAQTLQKVLIGQLRVPLTGPGSMSEGDRAMLEEMIADPTRLLSLGSSNKVKLTELKKALDRSLAAHAQAYGLANRGLDKQKAN